MCQASSYYIYVLFTKYICILSFAFLSMIVSSSSGKNNTLLGGLPTYEIRSDRSEIFQDLVTCISFIRLCQMMAYNKIAYSMGSIKMNKRTSCLGLKLSHLLRRLKSLWLVAQPTKPSKERRLDAKGEQNKGVRNEVWSCLDWRRKEHLTRIASSLFSWISRK